MSDGSVGLFWSLTPTNSILSDRSSRRFNFFNNGIPVKKINRWSDDDIKCNKRRSQIPEKLSGYMNSIDTQSLVGAMYRH